jgi:hypothetical protein
MNHLETGRDTYGVAISTLQHAVERLNSLPTDEFGSFEDLVDADCTAAAYEQIAEALEALKQAGVPFETIRKRLEGIPLQGELC